MEALFVPLALLAGALLTVQVGANTRLSKAMGGPFAATTLQLGVGAVALIVLAAAVGTLGSIRLLPEVTWWHAIGGSRAPSTSARPSCSSPGSAQW
jgi:transporter family-2 protein